jgi:hypothetical protein
MPSQPSFLVDYRASHFPTGTVQGVGTISFSANDLAHALFTTGRSPGNQRSYGNASLWEFVHRASLVPAYIRRDSGQHLVRSQLAIDLDRSEKVGVSYALGQALTCIFCRRLLSIPFLMHVDRYANHHGLVFGSTRKRADLFGYGTSPGWVVAEAKGRSNSMESELQDKLIEQKRSVISIEGQPPALALGCVASFPPQTSVMRVDAFDPEPEIEDQLAISVDLDRYMLAYYEPFTVAIDAGEQESDQEQSPSIISVRFQSLGIRIGLLRSIEQRVRRASAGELTELGQFILSELAKSQSAALFPDGSLFEVDWENSMTIDDWQH